MKKENKCKEGSDYPKEIILELIRTFGFYVDLDRWDEKDKNFMRIKSKDCEEVNIILYKDQLEIQVHQEREHLEDLFRNALISIGEILFKKKLHNLLSIDFLRHED